MKEGRPALRRSDRHDDYNVDVSTGGASWVEIMEN